MTKRPVISRRLLLQAGLWLLGSSSAWAQVKKVNDQGIGGTGLTSGEQDRGIGGTGIVGVIQRFGSIFVNGERVSYAANVPVRIDGTPASAKDLRIGHVVRVLAQPQPNSMLTTQSVDVVSEVAGPIEAVNANEITVLGQKVWWTSRESWLRPGTQVAVFGLRQTDGVIIASLIERRRNATARVTGLLERDRDGVRIGDLRLDGVDSTLVGQRVRAEGRVAQGVMQVASARLDNFADLSGASRLSIEAYVRRVGTTLQFGSGYVARDTSRFQPTNTSDARVVVNAVFDGFGGLRVESVQSVNRSPGPSLQRKGGPDRPPGPGRGPNSPGGRPDAPGGGGPARPDRPGGPARPPGGFERPGGGFPGGPPGGGPPGGGPPGGPPGGPSGPRGPGGGGGGGMGGGGPRR